MKKHKLLLTLSLLIAITFSALAQTQRTLYPGITEISRAYNAPFVSTPPVIDGVIDAVWDQASWFQAQTVTTSTDWDGADPVAPAGAFSGVEDVSFKFKMVWDYDHYYMLMRWTDDMVIYHDNHNGYPGSGAIPPPFNPDFSAPSTGDGDGTGFIAFKMDQISWWLSPVGYNDARINSYNRNQHGVWHTFFPGQITKGVHEDAVLWAGKHGGGGALHRARVAGRFDALENAYYIEFRDTTWSELWKTVSAVDIPDYAPAIGTQFYIQGEVNDADSPTNRRDYSLSISGMDVTNANNNLQEATIITLSAQATSVPDSKASRELNIYPNPNSGDRLYLNRVADVEIFNLAGQRILSSMNSSEINISSLESGIYMLKDNEGNVRKLVRK